MTDQKPQQQKEEDDELLVEKELMEAASLPDITSHDILWELFLYVRAEQHDSSGDDAGNKEEDPSLSVGDLIHSLKGEGIWFWRDKRFAASQAVVKELLSEEEVSTADPKILHKAIQEIPLDYDCFVKVVSPCALLFNKAFSEEHIVPDWESFVADLSHFFRRTSANDSGENAQYIPILKNADPEKWGLAVCSTDGQRCSMGDSLVPHTLQSVSKPITLAMGMAKEGHDFMDEWIDVEPAGRPFNTQDLDPATQRPFNASVNSGAIMTAGVVASGYPEETPWRSIVDQVRETWKKLSNSEIGFSQETFDSEKATAYNNFAIAYNLKGRRGLPRDVDLHKMLDVYLGCCSIEITAEALSVAAATLANGGVCPITGVEVFPADVVRSVLAETLCCGMYDQAGRFAVEVGLPAKSGVSGALMVIVPNVFGYATFSPRLNAKGNSVRGFEFSRHLVSVYRLHIFEPLRTDGNTGAKIDPRRNGWKEERTQISHMAWAVSVGDVYATRLRDSFLYALCRTALASNEGMSERMVAIIREKYEQVYLSGVEEKRLGDMQVEASKEGFKFLEGLVRGILVPVPDSMRTLTLTAMAELLRDENGVVQSAARAEAIKIAKVLGVGESIATLELDRCSRQIGHRYQNPDTPVIMESLAMHMHHPHTTRVAEETSLDENGDFGNRMQLLPVDQSDAADNTEELLKARNKALRLGSALQAVKRRLSFRPTKVKKKEQKKTKKGND